MVGFSLGSERRGGRVVGDLVRVQRTGARIDISWGGGLLILGCADCGPGFRVPFRVGVINTVFGGCC